mmetsp:Transcript_78771/g.96326  ORF Transcript_78771/g.96326 Transcript_78771/m.96326 type:complete len:416 (+) Transcript_78771:40-1287(+)
MFAFKKVNNICIKSRKLIKNNKKYISTLVSNKFAKKKHVNNNLFYCYNIKRNASDKAKLVLDKMKASYDAKQDIPTAFEEYFQEGKVSVRGALNLALYEEFDRDPKLYLLGEEVALYNGAYKISKGLWKKYGDERVIDTPITEMGFTGVGIGSALNGLHPIVEFMSFNFSMQAIDQIVNSAAKLKYMSGGKINCPITFRGCNGAAKAVAAQHSQCFAAWYSSVPGLKTGAIYDHIDARQMLKAYIRDPDPCLMLENEMLYGAKFDVTDDFFDPDYAPCEIGKIRVLQEGTDITIAGHGRMVQYMIEAAEILKNEDNVSVELINNLSLRPFDRFGLINSVKKTHRMVYVEEGWPHCGIASEVCAIMMESDAFDYLDAPVERVCGTDVPMPYCPVLETMVLPSTNDIVVAARRALKK